MILMANISSETNGFISHTATIYRANNSTLFIKKNSVHWVFTDLIPEMLLWT